MTDYMTKLDGSIKTIDATIDAGKKTQADVEAENYVYGKIPESDFYTCIDKANDAAYVLLRIGEGAKQEIRCSCDYFKKEQKTCEHLYALRDIDVSKLETSPNWLVRFLQVDNGWHIDDNNKLVPPSTRSEKVVPEVVASVPPTNEEPPKKEKKTCPHCNLTMPESRYEKHLSVCTKNPANNKSQGSPTVEPPPREKPKAPVIPPDPDIDIGVGEEVPVIIDDVPMVDEEGQEVYEKSPIDEGEIVDTHVQETIPMEIATALCNMQKTELFATTDSDNPFFSSKYADLASIWRVIRVPLTSSGLAIMQTTEPYQNGITVVTTLMHVSGVAYITRLSGTYSVTMDKKTGKPKAQTVQALGSLITYLRRYSLAALVGVASADDDGEAASGRDQQNKR